ncbi:AMP-binding protein [Pseudoalteromonas sp. MMG013]|uniref:non-ribosomal peptide synthetase n=1 Tax=Pseudoalteromonas sp. MMG013 TaxID=2822687 RepID=UPI001B379B21|nr:AMP-binding protein [Pseudoalteromonas sp. MMG013]
MFTNVELVLEELERIGASLSVKNGNLVGKLPKSGVSAQLKQAISAHKMELLKRLSKPTGILSVLEPGVVVQDSVISYTQQRFLMLASLGAHKSSNMPLGIVELVGKLNTPILRRALFELVVRHQVLASQFKQVDGNYSVSYNTDFAAPMSEIDLTQEPQLLNKVLEREKARTFELSQSPLFHLSVVRLGELEHTLVLAMHHIVTDGWSTQIFIEDLLKIYNALLHDHQPQLTTLTYQYKDYALAQQKWLKTAAANEAAEYWQTQLKDYQGAIQFPEHATYSSGDNCYVKSFIPALKSQRIKQYCNLHKLSPFALLFAVFKVVLYKYTGQSDIVAGTPASGRDDSHLQQLVGCFINHLAIRSQIRPKNTMRSFIASLSEATGRASKYQHFPFEYVMEATNIPRRNDSQPIFNVYFNYQNEFRDVFSMADAKVSAVSVQRGEPSFDLTFYVHNAGDNYELSCTFKKQVMGDVFVSSLLTSFQNALEQVLENDLLPISKVSMGNPVKLVSKATSQQPVTAADNVLCDIFSQAHLASSNPAIVSDNTVLSYATLFGYVKYYAKLLQNLPTQPVAIIGKRSPLTVIAMLAALLAKRQFVLISEERPVAQIDTILAMGDVVCILNTGQSKSWGKEEMACYTLALNSEHAQMGSSIPDTLFQWEVNELDSAYLSITSGSTGSPKLVMSNSTYWHRALSNFNIDYQLDSGDRGGMLSGIGHDPLHRDVLMTLCRGASLCIPNEQQFSATYCGNWLQEHSVQVLNLTPSFARFLLADNTISLPKVKLVLFCGEPLPRELLEKVRQVMPNARFVSMYGATETQQALSVFELKEQRGLSTRRVAIGAYTTQGHIEIRDESNLLCTANQLGEITFVGNALAQGYITEQGFQPFMESGGLRTYRTGDLGVICPDGILHFIARRDRQVKVNGYRIEPSEIEHVLLAHPVVKESRVVALEQNGLTVLHVFIISTADIDDGDIRAHLTLKLAHYQQPAHIHKLPHWPINAHNKIDQNALLALCENVAEQRLAGVPPSTDLQHELHAILASTLQLGKVYMDDNFLQLGGNSIQAAKVLSQIRLKYAVQLNLSEFFNNATLRQLDTLVSLALTNQKTENEKPVKKELLI